jgi:hypothetical protein
LSSYFAWIKLILEKRAAIAGFKLFALSVIAGYAAYGWLFIPLPEGIISRMWFAIGLVCAVAMGAIGTILVGKWLQAVGAETIGLFVCAAYAFFDYGDYIRMGFWKSVISEMINDGYRLFIPGFLAVFVGAFWVHIGLHRRTKYQHNKSDS